MNNPKKKNPIKILHLPLVFQSKEMFAWDARIYHLAEQFSKKAKRFTIKFFAPNKNPKPQPLLFGYIAKEFKLIGPSDAYLFSWELLLAAKRESVDIIHCHGFNNLITLTGILVKKPNQKLILTINSSKASSSFRELLWIPYVMLFQLLAHRVDHFIAVSEFEKKRFARLLHVSNQKFTVIPNGTEKELIDSINPIKKKGLIVTNGRLVKNKGFENVIRSFKKMSKKCPEAHLLIIGDGPERHVLEKLVYDLSLSGRVTFTGYIGRDRRIEFLTKLKEAELFIFLSNYEGLPLNVVEAVSAKLPSIISYNSGMAEFVDRNEAIGIFDLSDHRAIAEKILMVLEDPQSFVPKEISTKSWAEVADETIKVYEKVIG